MDLGDYIEVKDRLRMALDKHPDLTIVEQPPTVMTVYDIEFLICTVHVHSHPEDQRPVVASAWEPRGRTPYTRDSELMNGYTSAVGRALGYMGFGITRSIASANEVKNRLTESPRIDETEPSGTKGAANPTPTATGAASEAQKRAIYMIAKKKGIPMPAGLETWTKHQASDWIEEHDAR